MNAVLRWSFVHVVSAGNIYAQYRRSILCLYHSDHSDLPHGFEDLFIRLARLAFEGETEQSVDDDAILEQLRLLKIRFPIPVDE